MDKKLNEGSGAEATKLRKRILKIANTHLQHITNYTTLLENKAKLKHSLDDLELNKLGVDARLTALKQEIRSKKER